MLVKLFPWSFMQPLIGLLSFLFVSSNIFVCGVLIHLIGALQLLLGKPTSWSRSACDRCYRGWVIACEAWFHYMLGVTWQLDPRLEERQHEWHLVIANHRSWVDAFLVLAQVQGRIPMPRIFMKNTLFWLPLLGSATRIMGFPQVKRYSKVQIAKRPELATKDLQTTRAACRSLVTTPSSVMSFVEGTRFTQKKHSQQASPYQHLLYPRAGGIWMVLQAMPGCFHSILDMSIVYPNEANSYWDLLCGRVRTAKITVREIALPEEFVAMPSEVSREAFYHWFNGYWRDKDRALGEELRTCSILDVKQNATIKEGNGLQN